MTGNNDNQDYRNNNNVGNNKNHQNQNKDFRIIIVTVKTIIIKTVPLTTMQRI